MEQKFESEHFLDEDENPAGGRANAKGITVTFQSGPLKEGGSYNGAFVETLIAIAVDRMEFYQSGKFKCRENTLAITHLQEALHWMNHRTEDRIKRGVEGTHTA